MAICPALGKHGFLLQKNEAELYEIVDAAMSVAAWRNPKEFQNRRGRIAKNLFSLPEDVIGSCYQRSHCTLENTTSTVTKDAVVADNSLKKTSKKLKLKIKPYRGIEKNKADQKIVVSKIDEDKKNTGDENKKFEASVRKLEQRYKKLREGVRKTKVLDTAEVKDLMKPTREVKRPRFRR